MRFTRVPYREDFDARGAHSWRRLEGDQRQIVWHESEKSKKVESRKKSKLEKSGNSKKVETRKKRKVENSEKSKTANKKSVNFISLRKIDV